MKPLIAAAVAAAFLAGLSAPAAGLAAPTLHGVVQAGTSTSASAITMDRPPGTLAGDVLIAVVDARLPGSASITAPSGWYLLRRKGIEGGTSTALSQALYYRVAGLLEPSSYTWYFQRKTGAAGAVLAYGGVDVAAPIADHAGQVQSNSTSIVAPSVTTTEPEAGLLAFFGTGEANRITPPSGMTERHDISAVGNRVTSSESADAVLTTAGSSGERTATSETTARQAIGQLVALNAVSVTPPPPPPLRLLRRRLRLLRPPSPPPPPSGSVTLEQMDGGAGYNGFEVPRTSSRSRRGSYDHSVATWPRTRLSGSTATCGPTPCRYRTSGTPACG